MLTFIAPTSQPRLVFTTNVKRDTKRDALFEQYLSDGSGADKKHEPSFSDQPLASGDWLGAWSTVAPPEFNPADQYAKLRSCASSTRSLGSSCWRACARATRRGRAIMSLQWVIAGRIGSFVTLR
jgi:hypothetical protein